MNSGSAKLEAELLGSDLPNGATAWAGFSCDTWGAPAARGFSSFACECYGSSGAVAPAVVASCLHEPTVNYFPWAELCIWPGNVSLWLCLASSSANLYQFYFSIFPLA